MCKFNVHRCRLVLIFDQGYLVVSGKWNVWGFSFFFLRTGSKLKLKSSMTKTYQLAVELCRIATTDQGHEKEFLNWHNSPSLHSVDSYSHVGKTWSNGSFFLFERGISLIITLLGLLNHIEARNALCREPFDQQLLGSLSKPLRRRQRERCQTKVHFFAVLCKTTTWNHQVRRLRKVEDNG